MSFASPTLLWALLLLVPVVAAFLVRRRRRVVEVPSVLRWRLAAVSRHRSRRFRFLSRWVALLACVVAVWSLVVAAADPGGGGTARTTWVVLDGSASMGDAEGPWAESLRTVRSMVSLRAAGEHIGIVVATEAPVRLVGATTNASLLDAAVDRLEGAVFVGDDTDDEGVLGVDAEDPQERDDPGLGRVFRRGHTADLAAAIALADQLAQGARHDARIVLLHDGGQAVVPTAVTTPIVARVFGAGRENVGITAFGAEHAELRGSDAERDVLVGVACAGNAARRATVRLEADGVRVGEQTVELLPGEETDVRFRLRLAASRLVAVVHPADGVADDLPLDDRAELSLGRIDPPAVWTVSDGDDTAAFFGSRALRAAGATAVEALEGEQVPEGDVAVSFGPPHRRIRGPLLVLGGRALPADVSTGADADAAPPPNAAPLADPSERWPEGVLPQPLLGAGAVALRAVDDHHPVTRGVALDGVTVVRASPVDPGAGAALVELDGGTVVAAGGAGAGRWVYLGLEPGGSDVVLRVAYPLLVANALVWLRGGSGVASAATPPPAEVRLTQPAEAETLTALGVPELPVPPLPVAFGLLACVLLGLEGLAYARGYVR